MVKVGNQGLDDRYVRLGHRQPKRNMCGFGLQRSFGRIWSEYTRIISVLSDAK